MNIKLQVPDLQELKPRITVIGVGGAGGNAVNNMIESGLTGVEFVAANTDAQALTMSAAETRIQMGTETTEGLGAGSKPEVGREAAEEAKDELRSRLKDTHMVFVAAGMGGGTGTGAAPVVAQIAKEEGVLTVGVVTKPFHFEGHRRMQLAEEGIEELRKHVDTLIVIPNQNLFRIATDRTTFAESFKLADRVLHAGISCITDLMLKEGLVNLDFADVKTIMDGMGTAVMGTGHSTGENRAIEAAQEAINNQLLDDITLRGAKGLLISVTGGDDLTLFDVDAACTRIREEVEPDANVIFGAIFDETLTGQIRVSIVASGIDSSDMNKNPVPPLKHTMQNRVQQTAQAPTQPRIPPTPARPNINVKQASQNETPNNPAQKVSQTGARVNTNPRQQQAQQTNQPRQQKTQPVATPKMPPQPPQTPRPNHQNTDGVQIDYGLPNLSPNAAQKPPAAPRQQATQQQNVDEVAVAPGFTPQPPLQAPRSSSRIPTPEEFPPHIQHEIQPETGEFEQRGINQQKKKVGFLERLSAVTKGAFLDDSPKMEAPTAPQYPQEQQAFPENSQPLQAGEQPVHSYGENAHPHHEKPASQAPSSYNVRDEISEEREDIDIPPFLRKGRG